MPSWAPAATTQPDPADGSAGGSRHTVVTAGAGASGWRKETGAVTTINDVSQFNCPYVNSRIK
jgi:hypothetical protein